MASLFASFVSASIFCFAYGKHLRSDFAAPSSLPHLLEELENVLGKEHRLDVEARAQRLEEVMRPTYLSMPKDASGALGTEAVRYLLHRVFVDRHGWYVRGLHNSGDSWNSSSPLEAIKDHVNEEIPEVFDKHFDTGISLHHTAVLAATLERLVHDETVGRLESAYRTRSIDTSRSVAHDGIVKIVDAYMLLYIGGVEAHARATPRTISRLEAQMPEAYPGWSDTRAWSHEIAEKAINRSDSSSVEASFADAVRAVEAIADQYGRYQNQECLDLKASLQKMERNSTGRVPLDVFYQSALDGQWQFRESLSYLRQLGALDESRPEAPAVIIPNYLNGPSNCVASSKFYAVCCIDECEPLLGHIEQSVAAPDASPEFIVELVSKLPSGTVPAPRELPKQLVQRLQDIADHHGGTVPLHGRLFAQWLHHAYPRECLYPHLSGTTQPMSANEWKLETGDSSTSSAEAMSQHIENIKSATAGAAESREVPWIHEEELFIARPANMQATKRSGMASIFRTLSLFAALASMAMMLVRGVATVQDVMKPGKHSKYMV